MTDKAFTRRTALAGAAAALATPALGAAKPPFRASLSVSPFSEVVLKATALTDGRTTARTLAELQQLYVRHGATEVYARIATRKLAPQGQIAEHGWARGLERARFAKAMGLPFNPELGCWAEYGDGGNYQQPPDFRDYPDIRPSKPWLELTLDEMLPYMRQYGATAAKQILATGAHVPIWDIGNEVEFGIAGVATRPLTPHKDYAPPDRVDPAIGQMSSLQLMMLPEAERIAWSKQHLWPATGRLIGAVADGIRTVAKGAKVSTHISPLGHKTPAIHLAFWETVKAAGFFPDQFGLSYYPGLGPSKRGPQDTFAWFKDVATTLKARYGRPMFIAEGGVASGHMPPPFEFNDPVPGYPLTVEGQHAFNRDLIAWGSKSGTLAGYRPWAPDLCIGGAWEPMAWFDAKGKAKPVLDAFTEGLKS